MAGGPKGAGDEFRSWGVVGGEVRFDSVHEPEAGGVLGAGGGALFDEESRGLPLPEPDGVSQWGSTVVAPLQCGACSVSWGFFGPG